MQCRRRVAAGAGCGDARDVGMRWCALGGEPCSQRAARRAELAAPACQAAPRVGRPPCLPRLLLRPALPLAPLAQMLVELHGGQVPASMEALEALPGVGHKTAR